MIEEIKKEKVKIEKVKYIKYNNVVSMNDKVVDIVLFLGVLLINVVGIDFFFEDIGYVL